MLKGGRTYLFVGTAAALAVAVAAAQAPQAPQTPIREEYLKRSREFSARMEKTGLAEPFKGITTNGTVVPNLFSLRSTGVSTEPVRAAVSAFLGTLDATQRKKTLFTVDNVEWRKWANQHIYFREGISFEEMTAAQRDAAFRMLEASLSAKGLKLTRDIMRLNETLGELNGNNFVEYGESKYWISIMGEPSAKEPWGWQIDGHHLNVNYLVLGDQVVMTPAFWGSEPTIATSGRYARTSVLQDEQNRGLQMIQALTPDQQKQAIIQVAKTGNNILAQAFSDNVVLDYAGVRVATFSAAQKQQLLDLVRLYVGNLRDGHARVQMSEVERHLDATTFAWIGGTDDSSVYYYRVHSPVILIEFDHETPVNLRHLHPDGRPYREHIHSVVRTPNGNDYGKDLLRQHYQQHPH
jgi:hypothetical protein